MIGKTYKFICKLLHYKQWFSEGFESFGTKNNVIVNIRSEIVYYDACAVDSECDVGFYHNGDS